MANRPQETLNFKKGYGENFKKLRESRKLTQTELAEQIGYTNRTISLIEKEERKPTIEQLNIFCDKFNVSLDYLTGRTNTPYPDIQLVSEYTGLSEKAVDIIKNLPILDFNVMDYGELSRLKALDMIINSKYFRKLLDSVCEYSFVINNNPVTEVKTPTGELTKKFTQEQIESMFLTISGDIFKDILKTEFDRRENDEHNSKQK